MSQSKPIYLDHHATTPVDNRVLEAMLPYFTEIYGNASSIDHEYGNEASQAVETARKHVAKILNAKPDEIIFTSGATESDNLAILGIANKYADKGKHIITSVTEHKAVLDTCKYLEKQGWQITYLPVDQYGLVNPDDLKTAIISQTILISIMTANNEIGTIAPIKEIGIIAREHSIIFHTDAAQAVGHIPIDVEEMNVDMLSLSGHKIYGPKGVGALYVRKRIPRIKLAPITFGGGHERGFRSGTLNIPGIVGLGKALEIAKDEMKSESERLKSLRDKLWSSLKEDISNLELNGHPTKRLPHNLNFFIPGVEAKSLLVQLKNDIAISAGSACTSTTVEPSHVILGLGFDENRAYSSIRIGLGKNSQKLDVLYVKDKLYNSISSLLRLQ